MNRRFFALSLVIGALSLAVRSSAQAPLAGTLIAQGSVNTTISAPSVFTEMESVYIGSVPLVGMGNSRSMNWTESLLAPGGLFSKQRDYLIIVSRPAGSTFNGGSCSFYQSASALLEVPNGYVQAISAGGIGITVAERSTPGLSGSNASGSIPVPPSQTSFNVAGYHYLYLRAESPVENPIGGGLGGSGN
jgi:hypothetical protein